MKPSSPERWLIGIAAAVVVLIVVSAIIALTRPGGSAAELPENTPEGIVQRYIKAVQDQDYPLAHTYYSDRLKGICTVDYLATAFRGAAYGVERRRIELIDTKTLSGGSTQVRVRVTEVNVSPPFGVNEYSHEEWYVMIQERGSWRLDSPGWPVGFCPGITAPEKRF